jgi:uncharacterized protein YndB with AHSA1/START domain
MTIDIAHHIGAVTRTFQKREHNGQPAYVVIASRTYDTDVDDLWEAITSKERIPRWFLPVEGDLELGGHYQLKGNAGGTITRCEPPNVVGLTGEFGGEVSWVEVRLQPTRDGSTYLELEHVAHVPDERWKQYGPGAVGVGWDMALYGLAKHIATGAANDAREFMAWLGSSEGKDFVHRSSDDWCRAAIAGGTDQSTAQASAARTTAAYTGAPEPPPEPAPK